MARHPNRPHCKDYIERLFTEYTPLAGDRNFADDHAVMGGLAAGAPEPVLEALRAYGSALGLAFQIVDDVLDESGSAESLGKSPGKDRQARKMTYPAAVGLDASRERARNWAEQAKSELAAVPAPGILAALADMTVDRSR